MIYITGDTHGNFERIVRFCREKKTSLKDIMIVLGDAGVNYYKDRRDVLLKEKLAKLPVTLFMIHGNHEERPQNIETYKTKEYNSGVVYYEPKYPNLLFAKDGEIYDFNGLQTVVIGGAYSVDKMLRLIRGLHWFPDEQPNDKIKEYVERKLTERNWSVDVVLSHTAPLKYEPAEFLSDNIDQLKVDRSTETWLDKIEDRLDYKRWYFGHYHNYKRKDKTIMLFEEINDFGV